MGRGCAGRGYRFPIKQDVVVTGDKRIGLEAVITVSNGRNLTVEGNPTGKEI